MKPKLFKSAQVYVIKIHHAEICACTGSTGTKTIAPQGQTHHDNNADWVWLHQGCQQDFYGTVMYCMAIMEPQLDSAITADMNTFLSVPVKEVLLSVWYSKFIPMVKGHAPLIVWNPHKSYTSFQCDCLSVLLHVYLDVPSVWPKAQSNKSSVLSVKRNSIQLTCCLLWQFVK